MTSTILAKGNICALEQYDLSRVHHSDYIEIIKRYNGFYTKYFRFFGLSHFDSLSCDVFDVNHNPYFEYKVAPFSSGDIFVFGEDVFGDMYCFDRQIGRVLKICCEDLLINDLNHSSISSFIFDSVLNEKLDFIDLNFLGEIDLSSLSVNQHCSFKLPLMCGGAYAPENIDFTDRFTNWSILAQLYQVIQKLPPGTPIAGFEFK